MKILLASDTWSPMVNGVVRSVELLYHQLLALGHDVRVVTLAQNGHSHEENGILYVGSISAERVYPGVRISAAGALPISHWLDELEAWGPEVIHTQSEFYYLYAGTAGGPPVPLPGGTYLPYCLRGLYPVPFLQ